MILWTDDDKTRRQGLPRWNPWPALASVFVLYVVFAVVAWIWLA